MICLANVILNTTHNCPNKNVGYVDDGSCCVFVVDRFVAVVKGECIASGHAEVVMDYFREKAIYAALKLLSKRKETRSLPNDGT